MHREVPTLVVAEPLFSMTYMCARSIDRSAPLRAIIEVRFVSFGACLRIRGRGEFKNRDGIAGTSRAEARLKMKARVQLLAFVEFFLCAQHDRSTIADLQGQVSTGQRYRSADLYLGLVGGAILARSDPSRIAEPDSRFSCGADR